jgi:hypothetical protein
MTTNGMKNGRIYTPHRYCDVLKSIKPEGLPLGELLDLLVELGSLVSDTTTQVEKHCEDIHAAQSRAMAIMGTLYHQQGGNSDD